MNKYLSTSLLLGLSLLLVSCPLPPEEEVSFRFVALGDQGTGDLNQSRVAQAARQVAELKGADFLVLLGDNFYPSGVSSPVDLQWATKFEQMYGFWGIPVYPVLGNHDYGVGWSEDWKALLQVDYSGPETTWTMPGTFYHLVGPSDLADLVFLDTTWLVYHDPLYDRGQRAAVAAWLGDNGRWKLVFGHHPSLSNGTHGNAGAYDGSSDPVLRGDYLKAFYDQTVVPAAHLIFSGHDHNLQVLPLQGGNRRQIISGGGGASPRGLNTVNPSLFQVQSWGFFWVEVRADSLRIEAFDDAASLLWSEEIFK